MSRPASLLLVISLLGAASCSRSDGGRLRTIRESLDLWMFMNIGSMMFDSVPLEELRGVHLAGTGLLNHDVLVKGTVESSGSEGTYIVVSDTSARMLIDTTRISAENNKRAPRVGKPIYIHGEVKSGEKGHIYLFANAIRGG